MENKRIKLGTRIRIVNAGHCYGTYADMAAKMKLSNWLRIEWSTVNLNQLTGVVVACRKHEDTKNYCIGIRLVDGNPAGREVIMSPLGLESLTPAPKKSAKSPAAVAVAALKELQEEDDYEHQHAKADLVLCKLLKELGHDNVVEEYKKIHKWYA